MIATALPRIQKPFIDKLIGEHNGVARHPIRMQRNCAAKAKGVNGTSTCAIISGIAAP
jgi:hypothetical protein